MHHLYNLLPNLYYIFVLSPLSIRKVSSRDQQVKILIIAVGMPSPLICLFSKEQLARLSSTITVGKEIISLLQVERRQ